MSQGLPDGVSPTPEDVAEIFVLVVGDPQKNRIFGTGSLYNAQATSSYGDSSSISPLQPKLDEALSRLEAERERRIEMERRIADHESQIIREREEFERRMQEKLAAQKVQFTSKIARTEERLAVHDGAQGSSSRLVQDPVHVPVGPVTRARPKRFKESLMGLVQEVWRQELMKKPIEVGGVLESPSLINMIQYEWARV